MSSQITLKPKNNASKKQYVSKKTEQKKQGKVNCFKF